MNTRIYSTDKGQIVRNVPENNIIMEFGNLSWKLSVLQFRMLRQFITKIDGDHFEKLNANSFYRRKIRIPIKGTNLSILLSTDELEDLKKLINGIPEDALNQEDIFSELYKLTNNQYDRFDADLKNARMLSPVQKLFLN
ncbi:MAG: DUF6686 family protein [Bacteroidales bacterium]